VRLLFSLTLLCLLAGCSLLQQEAPDWDAGRSAMLEAENWGFYGRMAVKIDDATKADARSGGQVSVRWRQTEEVSQVRLSGPLGAGAWELIWEPQQVTASDADGERVIRYTGPAAAENFMRGELGWVFPADSIRYWVRGLPAPSTAAQEEFGEDGRLAGIRQQDWEVSYERYGSFDGLSLPARMIILGRGVRLKLSISKWQIDTPQG
jgi:outer membrane lipoprotein LolB